MEGEYNKIYTERELWQQGEWYFCCERKWAKDITDSTKSHDEFFH